MRRIEFQLTLIFYPSLDLSGVTCAHCLELDIVGQGPDQDAAQANLMEAIELYVGFKLDEQELDSLYCPAPSSIWNHATELFVYRLSVESFSESRESQSSPQQKAHQQKTCQPSKVSFSPTSTRFKGIAFNNAMVS